MDEKETRRTSILDVVVALITMGMGVGTADGAGVTVTEGCTVRETRETNVGEVEGCAE